MRFIRVDVDAQMPDLVPNIANLQRIVARDLVLQSEVVTLRVRRFRVIVLASEGNTRRFHRGR